MLTSSSKKEKKEKRSNSPDKLSEFLVLPSKNDFGLRNSSITTNELYYPTTTTDTTYFTTNFDSGVNFTYNDTSNSEYINAASILKKSNLK